MKLGTWRVNTYVILSAKWLVDWLSDSGTVGCCVLSFFFSFVIFSDVAYLEEVCARRYKRTCALFEERCLQRQNGTRVEGQWNRWYGGCWGFMIKLFCCAIVLVHIVPLYPVSAYMSLQDSQRCFCLYGAFSSLFYGIVDGLQLQKKGLGLPVSYSCLPSISGHVELIKAVLPFWSFVAASA